MAYQLIQAKPISYGGTRALSAVKFIVIHYTGVNNDTAVANCNYFKNGNTRQAGAHFFVDRAGTVCQSIPMNRTAWSVGGFYTRANGAGSYYNVCTNANSVSIELCDILNKAPSSAQITATKSLVAYIKANCPNAKTIIRHWDVNGKSCPARMAGKNNAEWNSFKASITGGSTPAPAPKPSSAKKSNDVIAQEVIDGKWGNNPQRANSLKAAGYDPAAIQAIVNQKLGAKPATKPAPATARKSNEQIANEVIAGKWNNGAARTSALKKAGYDPAAIQAIVNQKLGVKTTAKKTVSTPAKKSIDTIANEVIAGKWGNGNTRKQKLTAAGYNYSQVQALVNKKLSKR